MAFSGLIVGDTVTHNITDFDYIVTQIIQGNGLRLVRIRNRLPTATSSLIDKLKYAIMFEANILNPSGIAIDKNLYDIYFV